MIYEYKISYIGWLPLANFSLPICYLSFPGSERYRTKESERKKRDSVAAYKKDKKREREGIRDRERQRDRRL